MICGLFSDTVCSHTPPPNKNLCTLYVLSLSVTEKINQLVLYIWLNIWLKLCKRSHLEHHVFPHHGCNQTDTKWTRFRRIHLRKILRAVCYLPWCITYPVILIRTARLQWQHNKPFCTELSSLIALYQWFINTSSRYLSNIESSIIDLNLFNVLIVRSKVYAGGNVYLVPVGIVENILLFTGFSWKLYVW